MPIRSTSSAPSRNGFRPLSMILGMVAVSLFGRSAMPQVAMPSQGGKYPRVSLATGFEVDRDWPVRAGEHDHAWGAMAGIAIAPDGEIWTFNRGKVPVQVYSVRGELLRTWTQHPFREPHQIRFDGRGDVWLVDSGLHLVRKFARDGRLLLTLGTSGVPGEDATHFNKPTDVAITPSGEIFVSDGYGNNRIVHFDKQGKFVKSWGKLGIAPGEFSLPHSIALDSKGRLYVADRNNARVQVFDQSGRYLDEWRDIMVPWHIHITETDEIHVCGSSPMRWPKLPIPGLVVGIPPKDQLVTVFSPDGRVRRLTTFPKGQGPGELDWLHAITVDRRGNLYLGDIQGKRAQRFLRIDPGDHRSDPPYSTPARDPAVRLTSPRGDDGRLDK